MLTATHPTPTTTTTPDLPLPDSPHPRVPASAFPPAPPLPPPPPIDFTATLPPVPNFSQKQHSELIAEFLSPGLTFPQIAEQYGLMFLELAAWFFCLRTQTTLHSIEQMRETRIRILSADARFQALATAQSLLSDTANPIELRRAAALVLRETRPTKLASAVGRASRPPHEPPHATDTEDLSPPNLRALTAQITRDLISQRAGACGPAGAPPSPAPLCPTATPVPYNSLPPHRPHSPALNLQLRAVATPPIEEPITDHAAPRASSDSPITPRDLAPSPDRSRLRTPSSPLSTPHESPPTPDHSDSLTEPTLCNSS